MGGQVELTSKPLFDTVLGKHFPNDQLNIKMIQKLSHWSGSICHIPVESSTQLETDFDPVSEMETAVSQDLYRPMTFLLNYAFPFPHRIRFNKLTRRFSTIKGSLLRKVYCVLWTVLILWRLSEKLIPDQAEASGILTYFNQASYVFFMAYCSVLFILFWTKGQTFSSILNQGIDTSSNLCLKFQSPPRTRLIVVATHVSWMFCFLLSLASHVVGGIIAVVQEVTPEGNCSKPLFGYEKEKSDTPYTLNELDPHDSVFVHVLLVVANFVNTFNWMLSFMYLGIWALIFHRHFAILFAKIKIMNEYGYSLDLPQEIRTFNKIAALVDKFNSFHGLLVLWGAVVAILYISISLQQALTQVKTINQYSHQIHLFLSYVPVIVTALLLSDLHRKAGTFAEVFKNYYNEWTDANQVSCSKKTEALCGIAIVHHDIGMSNIGFKGLGFFTVTYQFVLTMLSAIITYALVVIQWFPQLPQASAVEPTV